jgi:hypothetical protein
MTAFKLDEHPKIESGFKAPEGYFENLSKKVNAQISEREPKIIPLEAEPNTAKLIDRRKTWMYAAAAVLVVGLGVTLFDALSVQSNSTDSVAIENYLASQATTEDLLVEALEKEDIEQLSASYNLDDQAIEDALANNTNLEQYIID